jgi:hypothetical protein
MMCNRLALLGMMLFGRGIALGDVTVDRKPAELEQRTFDPAHPPAEMPPLNAGEKAMTDGHFSCSASLQYQVVSHQSDQHGCTTTIQVSGVKLTLRLKVMVWLPSDVKDPLRAHETGHVRIIERVYEESEASGREMGRALDGAALTGHGSQCADAEAQAVQAGAEQICRRYINYTARGAAAVGDAYDSITSHGIKAEPPVDEAIRQAFSTAQSPARRPP